jgi:hypothetical protein
MQDTAAAGSTGRAGRLLRLCTGSRSVQQTAQRVVIALVVALLWQLASCSHAATPQSPAIPMSPRVPVRSTAPGSAQASPVGAVIGQARGLPARVLGREAAHTGTAAVAELARYAAAGLGAGLSGRAMPEA